MGALAATINAQSHATTISKPANCFRCCTEGHVAKDCPSQRSTPCQSKEHQQRRPMPQDPKVDQQHRCPVCGGYGHLPEHCAKQFGGDSNLQSEHEKSEMLKSKESADLVIENPSISQFERLNFSRNSINKANGSSFCESEKDGIIHERVISFERKSTNENEHENALYAVPEDRFHYCYIILYILGIGSTLPWSFFITANEYFRTKLESRPDFQIYFQNYFSVAAMVPNVLMMLLNIFLLHRLNRKARMCLSIIIMLLIFGFTTSLVLMDTTDWTDGFFAITISSVIVINVFSAVLQGGLFGFAGMLPPKYTQAAMGGQGLSGLFAAVASILSQLGENNVYKSAFGYFITASAVLLICFVAVIILFRLEFVKYYTTERRDKCTCEREESKHVHLTAVVNEDAREKEEQSSKKKQLSTTDSYVTVFRKMFPMAFSVTMIFLVTLSCFPAITSRIVSVSEKETKWTELFVPVTCFLFYNIGDCFGRALAGFIQIPKKHSPKWVLPVISIARLLFIPIFIFCNAQPRNISVVFKHDAFPSIFMLLFSVTNGYFASLAMMYGPSAVESQHAELAGTTMICCLCFGLGLGAASSFLVSSIL